jgi:hypothetical protein
MEQDETKPNNRVHHGLTAAQPTQNTLVQSPLSYSHISGKNPIPRPNAFSNNPKADMTYVFGYSRNPNTFSNLIFSP